ncbi:hypothetical protein AM593_05969, partial [Mytilus galloprovincialis]
MPNSLIGNRLLKDLILVMTLPEVGFKFNCGFDICTYPIQYCDTEDNRCGYCSDDICSSGSIPTQCTAECSTVEGAYLIATIALLLVLCLYTKKVWKLYRKRGKRNKSYTPLEAVKTEICIETVKVTDGILNQIEPGNQETSSIPDIPNPTEQATAPPQENIHEPSSPSYTDSPIVAHPDDDDKSPSHNFGDHNILSSSIPLEESIHGPPTIGPVSQAENEKKCEQLDCNILDNSEHFSKGIQDVTKHSVM